MKFQIATVYSPLGLEPQHYAHRSLKSRLVVEIGRRLTCSTQNVNINFSIILALLEHYLAITPFNIYLLRHATLSI